MVAIWFGLLSILFSWSLAYATTLENPLKQFDPFATQSTKQLEQIVEALRPLEDKASEEAKRDINLFKMRLLAIRGDYDAAIKLLDYFDQPNMPPRYRVRAYTIAIPIYTIQRKELEAFYLLNKMQPLLPWIKNQNLAYLAASVAPELYIDSGDLDKALWLAKEAMNHAEKTGKAINLCTSGDSLSGTYFMRNQLDLAEKAARNMLENCLAASAPLYVGSSYNILGMIYQEKGKHIEAIQYFEQAANLFKETRYIYGYTFSMLKLARNHFSLGHIEQATRYLEQALPLLEDTNASTEQIEVYDLRSLLAEARGEFDLALKWQRKKSLLESKVLNKQKAIRLAQLQVEFEIKQKEQALAQLTQENQLLALQKQAVYQRSLIIILGLIIIALVVVLLWLKAQRERSRFKHMSQVDPLTGLYNHAYCYSLAEESFHECRRQGKPFTVVVADIDWFKYVNDTYGHAAGDKVLQHIASILRECLGEEGIVGRTGGEEFTCFLPEKDLAQAMKLVEDCRRQIQPVVDYGKSIEVTLSYGLAHARGNYNTLDTLVRDADEALYKAKRNGRNQVLAFTPARKTTGT